MPLLLVQPLLLQSGSARLGSVAQDRSHRALGECDQNLLQHLLYRHRPESVYSNQQQKQGHHQQVLQFKDEHLRHSFDPVWRAAQLVQAIRVQD